MGPGMPGVSPAKLPIGPPGISLAPGACARALPIPAGCSLPCRTPPAIRASSR
jgi:hypothetical protein